ncbi:hypothetical protein AB1Y20_016183 [Prymnesium parvum]|uniref:Uncharacterized protein n=1 Tax=Prymnesium parvum TaxID=97485 RepID=A0AB34IFD9_PRYPA
MRRLITKRPLASSIDDDLDDLDDDLSKPLATVHTKEREVKRPTRIRKSAAASVEEDFEPSDDVEDEDYTPLSCMPRYPLPPSLVAGPAEVLSESEAEFSGEEEDDEEEVGIAEEEEEEEEESESSEGDEEAISSSAAYARRVEEKPVRHSFVVGARARAPVNRVVVERPATRKIEKILTWRWRAGATDDRSREFYVKWMGESHHHCQWISEEETAGFSMPKLTRFLRACDLPAYRSALPHDGAGGTVEEVVRPEWLSVDRVLQRRKKAEVCESLVKWKGLGYDCATWEADELVLAAGGKAALDRHDAWNDEKAQLSGKFCAYPSAGGPKISRLAVQPEYLGSGGESAQPLYPYQLDGLNWLRSSWAAQTNVMLADEMGLGKTIQSVAFISWLTHEYTRGPFLVCVPLSTLPNWEREFTRWAPSLNCVVYHGSQASRQLCRETEFHFGSGASVPKFNVLISSYEIVLSDAQLLRKFKWEALVVDEGHRLKSKASKLFQALQGFHTVFRLLLTGTPLQNNLEELWTLLHFLQPDKFDDMESFQMTFDTLDKEDQISRLHQMLAPHLLRRLKADVLSELLPKKAELLVRVELTAAQKELYQAILTRNFELLQRKSGQKKNALTNIVMELKKCANHPWLIEAPLEPQADVLSDEQLRDLVESCGKMQLLHRMLPKLEQAGHRVLIFSQMTRMLDVLEDYLIKMNFGFERLDGNVGSQERQHRIDRFNKKGDKRQADSKFVFLLSTRAGGLGINLATADTVVLYDSDWNPHNDIQALSRAHRLGQMHKVMIFRLVTRWSVEERIVMMAKKKMMMEHLVVRKMGTSGAAAFQAGELDDIIRFGTAKLFKDDDEASDDRIVWDDAAVERLLDRRDDAQKGGSSGVDKDDSDLRNEYMDSFKVANSTWGKGQEEEHLREEEEDPEEDPEYWESLLGDRSAQEQELMQLQMGRGKRERQALNYREVNMPLYEEGHEVAEKDDKARQKRFKHEEREGAPWSQPELLAWDPVHEGRYYVYGFSERERKAFLRLLMRYGLLGGRLNQLYRKCSAEADLRRKRLCEIGLYANRLVFHLLEADQEALLASDGAEGDDEDAADDAPHYVDEADEKVCARGELKEEEKVYSDGCPREKAGGSSSSPAAVLKRIALIERVRAKLLEAGLLSLSEIECDELLDLRATDAPVAEVVATANKLRDAGDAKGAEPARSIDGEIDAPAGHDAVEAESRAGESGVEPDGSFSPLRFSLPPPGQVMGIDSEYVALAQDPSVRLLRSERGWDLHCDKMLLLGIHKHGFAAGPMPFIHPDALYDASLGFLPRLLQQIEPSLQQAEAKSKHDVRATPPVVDASVVPEATVPLGSTAATPVNEARPPSSGGAGESNPPSTVAAEDDSDEDNVPLSQLARMRTLIEANVHSHAATPSDRWKDSCVSSEPGTGQQPPPAKKTNKTEATDGIAADARPPRDAARAASKYSEELLSQLDSTARELSRHFLIRRSKVLTQLLEVESAYLRALRAPREAIVEPCPEALVAGAPELLDVEAPSGTDASVSAPTSAACGSRTAAGGEELNAELVLTLAGAMAAGMATSGEDRAHGAETNGGAIVHWSTPEALKLISPAAVCYELQLCEAEQKPVYAALSAESQAEAEVGSPASDAESHHWRAAMKEVLREPRVHLRDLEGTAVGMRYRLRVRAYCGVFGWGGWSSQSEPIRVQ